MATKEDIEKVRLCDMKYWDSWVDGRRTDNNAHGLGETWWSLTYGPGENYTCIHWSLSDGLMLHKFQVPPSFLVDVVIRLIHVGHEAHARWCGYNPLHPRVSKPSCSSWRQGSYSGFIFTRHCSVQTALRCASVTPLYEHLPRSKATKPGDVWVLPRNLWDFVDQRSDNLLVRYVCKIRWGRQHGCWRSSGSGWWVPFSTTSCRELWNLL